jgi:hypothetical protein
MNRFSLRWYLVGFVVTVGPVVVCMVVASVWR